MIELTTQIDWWIHLLISALAGGFAALIFSVIEALKEITKEIKDDKGIVISIEIIEKEGIATKAEKIAIARLTMQGCLYGLIITAVMILVVMAMAATPIGALIEIVFGQPLSLQFCIAMALIVIFAISVGLHVKAFAKGGWVFLLIHKSIDSGKKAAESIGKMVETTVKAATENATAKVMDGVKDAVSTMTNMVEEMNEETEKITNMGDIPKQEEPPLPEVLDSEDGIVSNEIEKKEELKSEVDTEVNTV